MVIIKEVQTPADCIDVIGDVQFVATPELIEDRIVLFPIEKQSDGRKTTEIGYSLTPIGAVALAMDLLGQSLIATDDGVLDSLLDQVKQIAAAKSTS